jgi:dTDP-4-dehydrorhamnose 3,5-epimerase
MKFKATPISGAFLIDLETQSDSRGFFSRIYCEREFAAQGLETRFVQSNLSFNKKRGTLRGLHFQAPPKEEIKLVRCTRGAIFDVIVDLRPDSPTFRRTATFELTQDNRTALYVPKRVAHGFQTLADQSEVLYQMGEFYAPELSRGIRWDDPILGIRWPIHPPILSPQDAGWPALTA